MAGFMDRVRLSYNVLTNKLPEPDRETILQSYNASFSTIWRDTTEKVLAPIKTRIAMDAANVPIRHVRVDTSDFYEDTIQGPLNDRLTHKANLDQSGHAHIHDAVMTMLEYGVAAIVPIEVTTNPTMTTAYDILSMRVGVVNEWYNKSIEVSVYNEATGEREEKILPKSYVALCYNPLYAVMNQPNSTVKRLIEKLALLDFSDNKINSPNLDLILQLPYAIKNTKREQEANRRLRALEEQLYKSQYGVAYVDATEKITQLNRPVTNTLVDQVQYLTELLNNQLGLTPAILDGTASTEDLIAYHNRTIEPILKSITSAMKMTFLTQTAFRQGQSIMTFPNLFKMAPLDILADSADKFTRNEIMSSNEFRAVLGLKPRKDDPAANELRNKNINQEKGEQKNEKTNPPL